MQANGVTQMELIARTHPAEVARNRKHPKEVVRIKMLEQLCTSEEFARIYKLRLLKQVF